METLNPRAIKESFALIEPYAENSAAYFYARLFAENPRLRALFPPSLSTQYGRLFHSVTTMVWSIDSPESLAAFLSRLGRDHRRFGIHADHYEAMGHALLATLRKYAGPAWTSEMETAWVTAYRAATGIMVRAAEEDAADLPPWWTAEVVAHDRRTPDIAVLTVRPSQRLPYRAGQHVPVQAARWPREWRPYSLANAPDDDELLRFHVRAVPAGWVSGALVRHTSVGDTLLLGRATGSMTLEPDTGRDLLCVAGGTGLGPLKALAEEALRTRPGRRVVLLCGARTRAELYDLPALRALEESRPGLRVVPVVSGDPGFDGERGRVPDALGHGDDLTEPEVFVAGPARMVTRTVENLRDRGVPMERIHHDPIDGVVAFRR
jgi:NAD(P)H-flavin reductase/hemoglobin-like flavoprotein